jgi:hypothetical protein
MLLLTALGLRQDMLLKQAKGLGTRMAIFKSRIKDQRILGFLSLAPTREATMSMITKPILSRKGFDEISMLTYSYKQQRKIQKAPFNVLDAPDLQDDYYLNLVDWSNQNILAVVPRSCVYLWSASKYKITERYDHDHGEV